MIKPNTNSLFRFLYTSCLIAIVPFLLLSFFTIPSADDIFYHNYGQDKTLIEFLVHHYNTWTGRYFSNLMMAINPYSLTSELWTYPVMTILVQILFARSCFFFLRNFVLLITKQENLENVRQQVNKLTGLILLIWVALFLHKMPRPTDSFYWFAGSSSHLIAMSFVLINIGLYFQSFGLSLRQQVNRYLFISLLTICICGSNETLMLQWIFMMFFAFIYEKIVFNKNNFKILLPFIFSLICFVVVFVAPGNKIRAANLHGGHDILLLLSKPWGLIVETSLRYLSLNLLILLFWLLPLFKSLNNYLPDSLKEKKSKMLFLLFWLGLFALSFVPSVWTMGGLPPRRVLNNTYLMILFLSFFIVLVKITDWEFLFRWKNHWDKYFSFNYQKLVFLLSFLVLFNHYFAWHDLLYVPKFLTSLNEREKIITDPSNKNADVILEPLSYFPTTFFYEDITTDPTDYRNIVFAEFYKLKSVKLTKPYENSTW